MVVVKTQDALECTSMKQEDVVEVVAGAVVVKRQDALQRTFLYIVYPLCAPHNPPDNV